MQVAVVTDIQTLYLHNRDVSVPGVTNGDGVTTIRERSKGPPPLIDQLAKVKVTVSSISHSIASATGIMVTFDTAMATVLLKDWPAIIRHFQPTPEDYRQDVLIKFFGKALDMIRAAVSLRQTKGKPFCTPLPGGRRYAVQQVMLASFRRVPATLFVKKKRQVPFVCVTYDLILASPLKYSPSED